jgi:hypothetical protein
MIKLISAAVGATLLVAGPALTELCEKLDLASLLKW